MEVRSYKFKEGFLVIIRYGNGSRTRTRPDPTHFKGLGPVFLRPIGSGLGLGLNVMGLGL